MTYIINYGIYALQFIESLVDGEILLFDLNTRVLNQDLGVRYLHAGKFLREIKKLRRVCYVVANSKS